MCSSTSGKIYRPLGRVLGAVQYNAAVALSGAAVPAGTSVVSCTGILGRKGRRAAGRGILRPKLWVVYPEKLKIRNRSWNHKQSPGAKELTGLQCGFEGNFTTKVPKLSYAVTIHNNRAIQNQHFPWFPSCDFETVVNFVETKSLRASFLNE